MTLDPGYSVILSVGYRQGHIFRRSMWSSDLELQQEVDKEDCSNVRRPTKYISHM